MTEQEKELLLKDLCARLQYGVKAKITEEGVLSYDSGIGVIIGKEHADNEIFTIQCKNDSWCLTAISEFVPYLRPMSSMTMEEFQGLRSICPHANFNQTNNPDWIVGISGSDYGRTSRVDEISRFMDWLNAHHFDFRGLIEMGLALEATEGMYD